MGRHDLHSIRDGQVLFADTNTIVEALALRLRSEFERMFAEVLANHDGSYNEPGPWSCRRWYSAPELQSRWSYSKSTLHTIPAVELPFWKHAGCKRYFWAHVLAFERRISRELADTLYAVQEKELKVLARPAKQPARVRKIRADLNAINV